jgi:hypothetical protein
LRLQRLCEKIHLTLEVLEAQRKTIEPDEKGFI